MNIPENIPQEIERLLEKPVAVIGHGVSGQALGGLLSRIGVSLVFYDVKGRSSESEFDAGAAAKHPLVLFSPGFPVSHPWLETAREAGCRTMGELDFASLFWSGPLYCVTGSNGKTTSTELLASALGMSGRPALAVGNIGRPLSDVCLRPECEGRIAVCETSSFQAESLDCLRCDGLIWLNLFENHLDRHGSMRGYFEAKMRLVERLRKPLFVTGRSVARYAEEFGRKLPDFTQIVGPETLPVWEMPRHSAYSVRRQAVNLILIRSFWNALGMDESVLRKAAEALEPLPFRMNPLPGPDGSTYWNDSKATNHAACLGALENFTNKVIWIGGGKDRGENPAHLAAGVAPHVRIAILTGETASALEKSLTALGVPVHCQPDLAAAVRTARSIARFEEDILFSPGHSSHDAYRDYTERGRHFETLVAGLGDPAERLSKPVTSQHSSEVKI